jgi:hypothetical protein
MMNERTMFAVIADHLSTEITLFYSSARLTDIHADDLQNILRKLADYNPAWNDVRERKRIGVIFDAENGDTITLNRFSPVPSYH